jgi:hypothetical protein
MKSSLRLSLSPAWDLDVVLVLGRGWFGLEVEELRPLDGSN